MNISFEKKKEEALKRMQKICEVFDLGFNLVGYLRQDKIYYSYAYSMDTISYDSRYPVFVKKFEEQYNCFVYHVVEANTSLGKMLSLLYVSDNESDWFGQELNNESIMAYTFILEDDDSSCWFDGDFGFIGLSSPLGYLARIW